MPTGSGKPTVGGKPTFSRKPTVGGKPTVVGFTIRNRGLPELGHAPGWASETTRGKSGIGRQPAERVALPVKGSLEHSYIHGSQWFTHTLGEYFVAGREAYDPSHS